MRSLRLGVRWFFGTVFTATVIALPTTGSAAVYPTNLCVSKKLNAAGVACQQVLTAWSKWEKDPSKDPGDTKRDAAIATALQKMSDTWTKAEQGAAAKGAECAETTAPATDVQIAITTTAADIAAALNSDADTGDKSDMTCRSKLLKAAAKSCLDQLKAESKFVKQPGKDPEGASRDAARSTAASKFTDAWTKAACDATVTPTTVAGNLASTNDAIVRGAIISPAVADTWTKITPPTEVKYNGTGKKTVTLKPICSAGTPYAYYVKRGTSDNLLVYYQGGGACWDYLTCGVAKPFDGSVTDAQDNPANASTGFADLDNPANPFRDWNIVFVPYCTGDVHWGNATVTYTSGSDSVTIEHRGFTNAQVVEKWTREHFVNPPMVVVAGSSAGGYGALLNSMYLLEYVYPGSKSRVVDDAGNGVITDRFLQENIRRWGIEASLPRWIPDINKPVTELSIDKVGVAAAKFYPRAKFAQYTTAYDNTQIQFYNIMVHQDDIGQWGSWWLSACDWHTTMRTQALNGAAGAANYRYYIGPGTRHTVWGYDKVYSDTTGNIPTVLDWLTAMIEDDDANWQNEECADCSLLAGDPRPNPLQAPFGANGAVTCP